MSGRLPVAETVGHVEGEEVGEGGRERGARGAGKQHSVAQVVCCFLAWIEGVWEKEDHNLI